MAADVLVLLLTGRLARVTSGTDPKAGPVRKQMVIEDPINKTPQKAPKTQIVKLHLSLFDKSK